MGKFLLSILAAAFSAACLNAEQDAQAAWHYPLYLDGGSPMSKRVRVEIENKSNADFTARPIEISVKALGMAGEKKSALRAVSQEGKELLFAVTGEDCAALKKDSSIVVPIDCPANSRTEIWLYFGNKDALEVPDYYYIFGKEENFDAGVLDSDWSYKNQKTIPADALSEKTAKEGKSLRCVREKLSPYSYKYRLNVDSAESLKKRMYPKQDAVNEGDIIEVSADVKAENVEADKNGGGTIALIFNFPDGRFKAVRADTRLSGTTDWRKISMRAAVPQGATAAAFSTVADINSGEVFFDNLKIKKIQPRESYTLKISAVEKLKLKRKKAARDWEADAKKFNLRTTASFYNLGDVPTADALGIVPIKIVSCGNFGAKYFKVYKDGAEIPSSVIEDKLVFPLAPVGAKTEDQYNIYIAENRKNNVAKTTVSKQASYILSDLVSETKNDADTFGFDKILKSKANLLRNSDFENGLENWLVRGSKPDTSKEISVVESGLFGKNALQIKFNTHIKEIKDGGFKFPGGASSGKKKPKRQKLPNDYFGVRQEGKVSPQKGYALIFWLKSREGRQGFGLPRAFVVNGKNVKYTNANVASYGEWVAKLHCISTAKGDRIFADAIISGKSNALVDGVFFGECLKSFKFEYSAFGDDGKDYIAAWQVSPIVKVFGFFAPPTKAETPSVSLAKNEYENLQMAVRTNVYAKRLEIAAPAPRLVNPDGNGGEKTLAAPKISVAKTVVCDAPSTYTVFNGVKYNERCVPRNSMIEEYPDPLVTQNFIVLQKNKTESVWLNFYADETVKAGKYEGKIEFKDGGKTVASFPYFVKVRKFALPKKAGLTAIFDARGTSFNGGWRARRDIAGITSKFYDRIGLQEFLAKYRATVDHPEKIKFMLKDGKLATDFGEFDKFCEKSFGELGVKQMYLPQISSFAFANRFSRLTRDDNSLKEPIAPYEGKYPYPNADLAKFNPDYVAELQERVKLIYSHLKQKGWQDNFLWYVCDEPHCDVDGIADMVKAYCKIVAEAEPEARLYSSTWAYTPMLAGGINVWGLDMSSDRTPSDIAAIDSRKEKKLFTTDGNYCINTPYCAQERIMSIFCFAGGFEGYEYWGVDWYTRNPFKWGMHYDRISAPAPTVRNRTRYPNGDGYFVYSGEPIGRKEIFPSVRLESVRDGQEDYEYYILLEKLAQDKNDDAAKKTLAKVKSLAQYPNARGTQSAELLPNPQIVEELRGEVAEHIERLSE